MKQSKMKKMLPIILSLILVVGITLSGCGNSDNSGNNAASGEKKEDLMSLALENNKRNAEERDPDATSAKDTLTFAMLVDPGRLMMEDLMPPTTFPLGDQIIQYFIRWDYNSPEGGFYSPISDEFQMDEDGKGVTFKINKGIKNHDGSELTASDVLGSVDMFQKDSFLGMVCGFVDVAGSTIVDDYTLDLRFFDVFGPWESSVQMVSIYDKESYDAVGKDEFYKNPVSPAKYKLKEWESGKRIVFEAWEDYYEGTPNIPYLEGKVVSDMSVAYMELQNGDVDMLWKPTADQVRSTATDDNLQLLFTPNSEINYIGINNSQETLSNLALRQAIWHAIDREQIIAGAYDGLASPVTSILTKDAVGYKDMGDPYPYDVEKAKELMKEAGYENGLTLRFLAESTPTTQLVAEQLSAMLGEIGITLDINLTDYATQSSILYGSNDYDLFYNFSAMNMDSISYIYNPNLFGTTKYEGMPGGQGDKFTELCLELNATIDIEKRKELYGELQDEFYTNGCYWIPLNEAQVYVSTAANLKGLYCKGPVIDFTQAYFE